MVGTVRSICIASDETAGTIQEQVGYDLWDSLFTCILVPPGGDNLYIKFQTFFDQKRTALDRLFGSLIDLDFYYPLQLSLSYDQRPANCSEKKYGTYLNSCY